jgi:hypothetical protein
MTKRLPGAVIPGRRDQTGNGLRPTTSAQEAAHPFQKKGRPAMGASPGGDIPLPWG